MISSIRSINFSNNYNSISNTGVSRSKKCNTPSINYNNCDSVSFSGKTQTLNKLSEQSAELVQNFAKQLQLNKLYKFNTPDVEKFQLASVATREKPDMRNLLVQYSGYTKDDSTKHIMCIIKNNGEILESGTPVQNSDEIALYEQILPELIHRASKELKIKLNMPV